MTTLFLILLASLAFFAMKAHGLRVIDAEDALVADLVEDDR
jgi:hypothetical protein